MIKKIALVLFNVFIVAYLIYPIPNIPDLPNSVISTEPGDTVQIKNVKAFYTDLERSDIISFYQKSYQDKHPLAFRLNHPPEKAKQIIRDTIQTYYLEEIVIPFKQSLFINGFDWQKDVFTKEENKYTNKMLVNGQEYRVKVTLRTFTPSNLLVSYLILLSIQIVIILFPKYYKKIIYHE